MPEQQHSSDHDTLIEVRTDVRQIKDAVFGKDGDGGIKKQLDELRIDRAKMIGILLVVGVVVPAFVSWFFTQVGAHP